MWKTWEDHDEFHVEQFDRVFELCGICLGMVIEGPWEPVYTIVKARMAPIRSMGQIADLAEDIRQKKNPFVLQLPRDAWSLPSIQ